MSCEATTKRKTPADSPALTVQATGYPPVWRRRVPRTVRLACDVRPDPAFRLAADLPGPDSGAWARDGAIVDVYVNMQGAVAAILPGGLLGLRPYEFEVIAWHGEEVPPAPAAPPAGWRRAGEWHEDDGPVLWAYFDDGGWPDVHFGSPLDDDWPGDGHFPHWMTLPDRPEDVIPFSLSCRACSAEGPGSRGEAEAEGWHAIEYDDGAGWNFLGLCPDCAKEEARDILRQADEQLADVRRELGLGAASVEAAGQDECARCRAAAEQARAEWDAGGSPPSLPVQCPHQQKERP